MAIIYATVTMTIVIGFAAFTIDLSRGRSAKGELRAASDSAALNAANGLVDNTYVAKAQAAALENKCDYTSVSIAAANVTCGNWDGSAFVANGTPRNAVQVIAERVKSKGTGMNAVIGQALGWSMPDISGTTIVALVNQSPYEWSGINSVNIAGATVVNKVSSYDSTNALAPEQKTTIRTNGSFTATGSGTLNADVKYGTSTSISGTTTFPGSTTLNSASWTYPTGAQAANLNGVTTATSSYGDLVVNTSQSLAGGVYYVNNCTITNCTLSFTGPATIVVAGNFTSSNVAFNAYGNLPANVKIIGTSPAATFSVTNPIGNLNADWYAPGANFTYSSALGYGALKGRGVFKSFASSGAAASVWYDRALNSAVSQSRKAELVK